MALVFMFFVSDGSLENNLSYDRGTYTREGTLFLFFLGVAVLVTGGVVTSGVSIFGPAMVRRRGLTLSV
jgi:hypothetical protein